MSHTFYRWNGAAPIALVALAACVGHIGDHGTGIEPPLDPASTETTCNGETPPVPMRRLSRAEYLATVRDLFPGVDVTQLMIGRDPNDQGFENRADLLNPQPLLIEQYNTAASEIAAKVIEDPASLLPCSPTPETEADCGAQFVESVGQRVFRRPLTDDEKTTYTDFLNSERAVGSGFDGAVQLTLESMLQAPQFLYRLEFGEPNPGAPEQAKLTPFEVATRMSYLLWGSTPDEVLLDKAASDQLATAADRETEARRMLSDPRARDMMIEFHRQWLDFDRLENEPKDPDAYPAYTSDLEAAIREESDRFIASVMWEGDGTVRSLLTSTTTEVNAPLAELYGVPAPADGWAEVSLDPEQRAGFLTRANFLASRAHKLAGSPPLRAIFVLKRMLCLTTASPPANADLSEPAASPGDTAKTNRQLFEERLTPAACSGCHSTFTGLGYAFENFDAIGRYRTEDNGFTVDASGQFSSGEIDWKLAGAVELSQKLADSPEVQSCVATSWYEYAVGRAQDGVDECAVESLGKAMIEAQGDIRELLVAIVKRGDFVVRPVVKP